MKMIAPAGVLSLLLASPAFAGLYTDDLSRCLVEKTTHEDKTALVQWIFVAMAQHPSVAAMTRITPEEVDLHNKQAADLLTKLLTETCEESSRKAIKYEGAAAIQMAFAVFGQAAASELFAHANVKQVMAGLDKFIDKKKIEALAP